SADLFKANIKDSNFSGADLSNADVSFRDIESAKTDDKTKMPEKGFFFFRELYSIFRELFFGIR
ncbi:MAG: pentapeptide repeat-containing protein, partial [Thaumarchaeota archaeon]|nr:pentapeptide repeat-containing protein [Nitrososphaerota archaeon]